MPSDSAIWEVSATAGRRTTRMERAFHGRMGNGKSAWVSRRCSRDGRPGACGCAHFLGRALPQQGHEVCLIPAACQAICEDQQE
jgi:hypothetical protein